MAATLRQRYGKDRVGAGASAAPIAHAEIGHEDVERVVGVDVAHTFPSDYRLALQALNKGRPLVLDNHNKLAAVVHELRARARRRRATAQRPNRPDGRPVRPAHAVAGVVTRAAEHRWTRCLDAASTRAARGRRPQSRTTRS